MRQRMPAKPPARKLKADRLRAWGRPVLIVSGVVLCGIALYCLWPRLTGHLRAVRVPDEEAGLIEVQRGAVDLEEGNRIASPDGSMYILYRRDEAADRRIFRVFDARSGRPIGSFTPTKAIFRGWAEDSSGFYVNVWLPPGLRSMTWMSGGWAPLSKVRIPGR